MVNGEEQKKPPVTPPPPVEPQEYFPGFKLESTQLARSRYQAQKRLTGASRELEKTSRFAGFKFGHSFGLPMIPFPQFVPDKEFQQLLSQRKAAVEVATQEYTKVSWRQQVLQSLPIILLDRQSGIRSIDDVVAAFPNEFIDDSDQQWLQGIWNKAEGLRR